MGPTSQPVRTRRGCGRTGYAARGRPGSGTRCSESSSTRRASRRGSNWPFREARDHLPDPDASPHRVACPCGSFPNHHEGGDRNVHRNKISDSHREVLVRARSIRGPVCPRCSLCLSTRSSPVAVLVTRFSSRRREARRSATGGGGHRPNAGRRGARAQKRRRRSRGRTGGRTTARPAAGCRSRASDA